MRYLSPAFQQNEKKEIKKESTAINTPSPSPFSKVNNLEGKKKETRIYDFFFTYKIFHIHEKHRTHLYFFLVWSPTRTILKQGYEITG